MPLLTTVTQRQLSSSPVEQDLTANVATVRFPSSWRSVLSQQSTPTCLAWNSSGTRLFVGGSQPNRISEYTVSPAWDLAGDVQWQFDVSTATPVTGMCIRPDDTQLFWLDGTTLHSYLLTTAGRISDGWTLQATENLTALIGGPPAEDLITAVTFAPTGLHFVVSADVTNRLIEFSLSVAWDLSSTVSVSQTLSYSTDGSPLSIQWSSDGLRYWVLGGVNQRIYQYSADSAHRLPATLTQTLQTSVVSVLAKEAVRSCLVAAQGQRLYLLGTSANFRRVTQVELAESESLASLTVNDSALADQQTNTALTGIEGATSVAFRPDGLRMYTLNSAVNRIFQSTLTTAWDISSAAIDTNVTLSAGPGQCRGLYLHPEGTSYFVVGTTEDRIYQWSMPTPWDITGSTNLASSDSFSSQETQAHGVFFRRDGLRAWIIGQSSNQVHEYQMSAPWDLSSLTYQQSGTFTLTLPTDLAFSSSGRRLWLLTTSEILQYRLTTPWDVSTKQFETTISLRTYDSLAQGFFVRADGRKIYMVTEWSRWVGLTLGAPTTNIELTSAADNIDEGSALTLTVATANIRNGTVLRWRILDRPGDFLVNTGLVSVSSNAASFTVTPTADLLVEGSETFRVRLEKITGTAVATTSAITINDTSAATFTVVPNSFSVNEGDTVTVTVTVTSGTVPDGTIVYWAASSAADVITGSGTVTINSNTAQFSLTIKEDRLTEGTETITVSLLTDPEGGFVMATSDAITIADTSLSPVYNISTLVESVNEGGTVLFSVSTERVDDGTTLYWTTSSPADFVTSSGLFTVNSSAGQFTVSVLGDFTTEGSETFTVSVRTNSISGDIVATSSAVTINDTSIETYALTPSAGSVNEGSNLSIAVSTQGVPNGTTLYWTSSSPTDLTAGNGTVVINDGQGTISISISADASTEGTETFTISLRTGSVSGNIVATTSNITINDTSLTPVYSIAAAAGSVNEGSTIVFNVTTNNVNPTTSLAWEVSGVSAGDLVSSGSGSAVVTGSYASGSATISVQLKKDFVTEGAETLTVTLISVPGTPSASVTVNDTAAFLSVEYTFQDTHGSSNNVPTEFGYSVALTGDIAVIGSNRYYANSGNRGRTYVYSMANGNLLGSTYDYTVGGQFNVRHGFSVAANGKKFWAGAPYDYTGGVNTGSVWQYVVNSNNTISTVGRLGANFEANYEFEDFGWSISANDSYVMIGVPNEQKTIGGTAYPQGGYIAVYNHSGNLIASFSPSAGAENFTRAGRSVAIAPGTSTSGATGEFGGYVNIHSVTSSSGITRVFDPTSDTFDGFGRYGLAHNGTYIAVGSPLYDVGSTTNRGRVYVYNTSGTLLATIDSPVDSNMLFGFSVAMNSNYLAVGAPYAADGGKVYLYNFDWNLQHTISSPNSDRGGFGTALSMTNTKLLASRLGPTGSVTTWEGGEAYVIGLGS